VIIRPERKKDYAAIYEVNKLAFNGEEESKLIQTLRETSDFNEKLSLVAINDEKIVGHILFTPITIETKGISFSALALAPLAVHPEFQNQGIGSELVNRGLRVSNRLKYEIVVVVGHPEYYKRFGFVPASNRGLKIPFDVPDEVFLIREDSCRVLDGVEGFVKYPKAFLDLI
jgi:putative acetyltransferase